MRELDLERPAGGVLHAYDAGPTGSADELVVFWHGGTPNTGLPPEPLLAQAASLGLRFVGADRPGYGGTTRDPDASVADAVPDVLAVADAVGAVRFAVLGHSGGGPRALACAALAGDRLRIAAAISSPAPVGAPGLDRFAGMAGGIVREQEAATAGREALLAVLETGEFDETAFTPGDLAALGGPWGWFQSVVAAALEQGLDAEADDLLAAARPWGFDLTAIAVPVLLLHGGADRMVPVGHARAIAARVPTADLRVVPGAGHIDVLVEAPSVLRAIRDAS
jgi:pimeloyl-ACP methyl ester carboxylesterase